MAVSYKEAISGTPEAVHLISRPDQTVVKVGQYGDVYLTKDYRPDFDSLRDIFSDNAMQRHPGSFTANMNEGLLFTHDDEGLVYELSYSGSSSVYSM